MKHRLESIVLSAVACLLLCGCGPNWSDHNKWPEKRKFKGTAVTRHMAYLTGDYDTQDAHAGETPATFQTYYSYKDKDGEEVRHGKFTAWYAEGRPKAETFFVHGKAANRTLWYFDGTIAEKSEWTDAGERMEFFGSSGAKFGIQTYDKVTGKRTFYLDGKIVDKQRFMTAAAKRMYGQTRITP